VGVVGRDVQRGWWLEDGWSDEVGDLNCDCGELGFAVPGLRKNVVWSFSGSMWRGHQHRAGSLHVCEVL
jgi:hypothetical protein